MMKPNDFCVNDVNFRCVWGSRTTWDAMNEIQKERKDKIVFHGTVEERGEGSRYAFFRDDEQGINYLIPIQESGQQDCEYCKTPGKTIAIIETDAERFHIGIYGGYLQIFDEEFPGVVENIPINNCPICGRKLGEYQKSENEIFKSAVHWWGKEAQTDMMIEEMAELTKAILNERRGRDHNIAEEMADVRIMLAQMEIIFQNAGEVEQRFREKIARLDQRLQERRGGAAHE